jgi:hypothetical protein
MLVLDDGTLGERTKGIGPSSPSLPLHITSFVQWSGGKLEDLVLPIWLQFPFGAPWCVASRSTNLIAISSRGDN